MIFNFQSVAAVLLISFLLRHKAAKKENPWRDVWTVILINLYKASF